MGKEEISPAIKQTVISEIESGRLSQSEAARRLCVGRTTILERDFYAPRPNEKWLTDVTEFKWYEGVEVHKVYLSAILDLYDRRIVSYIISEHNDIPIVFNAFKAAVKANPDAHPLFHSDRGLRYISRIFHQMLEDAGMTQSISRVAHCIDNGPMEGFWGILKREKYYDKRFTSGQELVQMIQDYIYYYNTERVQRNPGVVTPMEKYQMALAAQINIPRPSRGYFLCGRSPALPATPHAALVRSDISA